MKSSKERQEGSIASPVGTRQQQWLESIDVVWILGRWFVVSKQYEELMSSRTVKERESTGSGGNENSFRSTALTATLASDRRIPNPGADIHIPGDGGVSVGEGSGSVTFAMASSAILRLQRSYRAGNCGNQGQESQFCAKIFNFWRHGKRGNPGLSKSFRNRKLGSKSSEMRGNSHTKITQHAMPR